MRIVGLAAVAGFVIAVSGVVVLEVARSDEAGQVVADQEVTHVSLDVYHPALGEDEHPSIWIDDHPLIVRATVRAVGDSVWTSKSGEFEGIPTDPNTAPSIIATELVLDVSEYIKGSSAEELRVAARGGTVDGVVMDWLIPLEQGDQAVLFLSDPHPSFGGPIVNNAYVFDGDIAYSEYDQKTLLVSDLLSGLREAAPPKTSD